HVGILEAGHLLTQGSPAEILKEIRQARTYHLRLARPGAVERALEVLSAQPGVSNAWCNGGTCEFLLAGGDEAAAEVLAALVAAGVGVAEFSGSRRGLEELFMSITKGVVQ
ncbi:MAG: ABC transporter ATP-binding protein, partial [Actinomycetota bacterium]